MCGVGAANLLRGLALLVRASERAEVFGQDDGQRAAPIASS
jgi:hypothetical protein